MSGITTYTARKIINSFFETVAYKPQYYAGPFSYWLGFSTRPFTRNVFSTLGDPSSEGDYYKTNHPLGSFTLMKEEPEGTYNLDYAYNNVNEELVSPVAYSDWLGCESLAILEEDDYTSTMCGDDFTEIFAEIGDRLKITYFKYWFKTYSD